MVESAQEYAKRIVEYLDGQEPMAVLAATSAKLGELVRSCSPDQLSRRPAPGKWSVVEILAHLADVEMVVGYRIRLVLSQSGTSIQAFDQDAWAAAEQYAKISPEQSLEAQRALRVSNVALLRSLSPDQWQHYGVHAERGKEDVTRIATMLAGHDLNHLRQIRAALGS